MDQIFRGESNKGFDTSLKPNCNYGKVNVWELPNAGWAQNLTGGDFYFKKGYTAFHIFLRLLGNFCFGSTVRYNFLTGKKQNFVWDTAVMRLLSLLSLGGFIAHFFSSCPLFAFFAIPGSSVLVMSVIILFYCAVITVKAAKMIRENRVQIDCCPECGRDKSHHLKCFENNKSSHKECDQGHNETLPMILSVGDVTSCLENKSQFLF